MIIKNMSQRIKCMLFLSLFCANMAYPQEQPGYPVVNTVSPEAAALVKAINYPVGYNSGVPSISIPLYEFKGRELSIPLVLNYHAGGFKAREQAPSTGMGWTLGCDLQITREIKGGDDFKNNEGYELYKGLYYNRFCYHYDSDAYDGDLIDDNQNLLSIANGEMDTQPDKFYYKLPEKSGCFYLVKNDKGRYFVPVPYNGIKIECFPTGHYNDVNFRITDTDGTQYNYTVSERQRLYPLLSGGTETQSAWKCTSIVSPSGCETLHIDYQSLEERGTYISGEYIEFYEDLAGAHGIISGRSTFFPEDIEEFFGDGNQKFERVRNCFRFDMLNVPRTVYHSFGQGSGLELYTDDPEAEDGVRVDYYEAPREYAKLLVQTRMGISGMELNGDRISFLYDNEDCMTEIRVARQDGTIVRRIQLSQSKTGTWTSVKNTSRTNYLDAVTVKDGSGNTAETYKLDYTAKYAFSNYLKGFDAWGGVNSKTHRMDALCGITVPAMLVQAKHYYADAPSAYTYDFWTWIGGSHAYLDEMNDWIEPEYALMGQLERITYPTGGYTEFSFENNMAQLLGTVNSPFLCGGLRVTDISNYDSDGSLLTRKKFVYGDDPWGTGIPNGLYYYNAPDMDETFNYKQTVMYLVDPIFEEYGTMLNGPTETRTTFLAYPLEDLFYSNGSPIYYTKVTEYDYDTEGLNGKKEFIYTDPAIFGLPMRRKIEGTNLLEFAEEWRNGQVEQENVYKYEDGNFIPVHSKRYRYRIFRKSDDVINTFFCYRKMVIMGVYDSGDEYDRYTYGEINDAYTLRNVDVSQLLDTYDQGAATGDVLPVEIADTVYAGGKKLVTVTGYEYDALLQPTTVTVTYPEGETEKTVTRYAAQCTGDFVDAMEERHMVGVPIQVETERMTENGSTKVSGSINIFDTENPALVKTVYKLDLAGNPGSSNVDGFLIPGEYYEKSSLLYNAAGNIVQISANNLPVITYLWGYGHRYPVAEIKGATYEEVCTALGTGTVDGLEVSFDDTYIRNCVQTLREHALMAGAQVTTFLYLPLTGMTETVKPDGTKENYMYDGFGRLRAVDRNDGQRVKTYEYHYMDR